MPDDKLVEFRLFAVERLKLFQVRYDIGVHSSKTIAGENNDLEKLDKAIKGLKRLMRYKGRASKYSGLPLIRTLMEAKATDRVLNEKGGLLERNEAALNAGDLYDDVFGEWMDLIARLNSMEELISKALDYKARPTRGSTSFVREIKMYERDIYNKYIELFGEKPAMHEYSSFIEELLGIYEDAEVSSTGILNRYKAIAKLS